MPRFAALRARFPGVGFAVVHMNPIAADRGLSTGLRIHDRLYSLLEPAGRTDDAVNLVGNFVGLEADCELLQVLRAWGVTEVRQLFACKDYAAYQDLAASRLDVVLARRRNLCRPEHADAPGHSPGIRARGLCDR